MAIPGLKPNYDVRAKVRIGEKKEKAGGKSYPSAVDYFICDDPEFQLLAGDKPKELRVIFPFETPDEVFPTGMEMWRGKQLSCYSKGEPVDRTPGAAAIAYRVNALLKPEDDKVGPPMGRGKERTPIVCPFRSCAFFKDKSCKPMGRVQFFLEGGAVDAVYQIDTKSWNTIEGFTAALAGAAAKGDLRGRVFVLSVEIVSKATQKFPVMSLKEADVNIATADDVEKADALVALRGAVEHGGETFIRQSLAAALDRTNPGWRDKPAITARIKEVGVPAAAKAMLERYGL